MKSSSAKSWIILFTVSLAFLIIGHTVWGRQGLLLGFILALGINTIVYFYSGPRWLNSFRARKLEGRDSWGALEILRLLTTQVGLAQPEVYVIPLNTPTAFSIGFNAKQSKILLSEGLLSQLSRDEIEAVFAQQLSHIRRDDTLLFGVTGALVEFLFGFATLLDHAVQLITLKKYKCEIFRNIMAPFVGIILRITVGRRQYFSADQYGSKLLGSKERLARVLWKLESYARTGRDIIPPATSHFFIINPLTRNNWGRHFQLQPRTEDRIEHLVGKFPV